MVHVCFLYLPVKKYMLSIPKYTFLFYKTPPAIEIHMTAKVFSQFMTSSLCIGNGLSQKEICFFFFSQVFFVTSMKGRNQIGIDSFVAPIRVTMCHFAFHVYSRVLLYYTTA